MMKKNNFAPILGINRLRMGTDGKGITSLVTFYGCPLKCKFCLNPQCHRDISEDFYLQAHELYNRVLIDELYFLATGGGLTFGGGEPLLYSDYIIHILRLGAKKWNVTIETSLNVPYKQVDALLPYTNELIVDIKDINPQIYKSYTQADNNVVIENLKILAGIGFTNNVTVRIPRIKGYNNDSDTLKSKLFLQRMGYSKFDFFDYKIEKEDERER